MINQHLPSLILSHVYHLEWQVVAFLLQSCHLQCLSRAWSFYEFCLRNWLVHPSWILRSTRRYRTTRKSNLSLSYLIYRGHSSSLILGQLNGLDWFPWFSLRPYSFPCLNLWGLEPSWFFPYLRTSRIHRWPTRMESLGLCDWRGLSRFCQPRRLSLTCIMAHKQPYVLQAFSFPLQCLRALILPWCNSSISCRRSLLIIEWRTHQWGQSYR